MQGRVFAPVRSLSNQLGATVFWELPTQTVRVFRGSTRIELRPGTSAATVDGQTVYLDIPPQVVAERILISLRFLVEALGYRIEWQAATRTALIVTTRKNGTGEGVPKTSCTEPGGLFSVRRMAGDYVASPVATRATGLASFSILASCPPNGRPISMSFSVYANQLFGITAVHIHSGGSGRNGPVRVVLYAGPPIETENGLIAKGSIGKDDINGVDFNDLCQQMRWAETYVDVHTVTYPEGEIRGQIDTRPMPLPFRTCGRP